MKHQLPFKDEKIKAQRRGGDLLRSQLDPAHPPGEEGAASSTGSGDSALPWFYHHNAWGSGGPLASPGSVTPSAGWRAWPDSLTVWQTDDLW